MAKTPRPKTPPPETRPAKDWHVESRKIYVAEGPSERFFKVHEKEIADYLRVALKHPLPEGSELFPKGFEPGKTYGHAEGPVRGSPPPDKNTLRGTRDYFIGECRDGGRLLNEFPRETQHQNGIHELAHHLLEKEISQYAGYLFDARRRLEADPKTEVPPHSLYGSLDKDIVLKLRKDIDPHPLLQRSPFSAHLAERGSDVLAALFRLSQHGASPHAERIFEQLNIFSHYRASQIGKGEGYSEHYSHNSMQKVLELYRQGKIPANLSLEKAREMTRDILRQDMPAIAQEYLALRDIKDRTPLASIDPNDAARFEKLKQLTAQRQAAPAILCAPVVLTEENAQKNGTWLKKSESQQVEKEWQREGFSSHGDLRILVKPNEQKNGYEIRAETLTEEPSPVAGGESKFYVDKTISVNCDGQSCTGEMVDYSRDAERTPLSSEKAQAFSRAVEAKADNNPLLKSVLRPAK